MSSGTVVSRAEIDIIINIHTTKEAQQHTLCLRACLRVCVCVAAGSPLDATVGSAYCCTVPIVSGERWFILPKPQGGGCAW